MNDKISIVVPVFNVESYVQRGLKSILEQTYTNLEIIAVDDGSTDSSGQIIDRLAGEDPRIKPIHKENGGVTSARIEGIRNATGEWIGFVDGDDEIEPDMYRRLLENAEKYQADISHCGYQMIFPNGHIDYYYNSGVLEQHDRMTALKELISGTRIEPSLGNKLFRRTLFAHMLSQDTMPKNIRVNEDLLMNYLAFKEASCAVFEDFCPYHYIVRRNSAANARKRHHYTDPLKVRELIKNDLMSDQQLLPAAYSKYVYELIRVASQRKWKEESQAAVERLRQEFRTKEISNCDATKLKLMSAGAGYLLPLYRFVRRCYDRVTGASKKYDF